MNSGKTVMPSCTFNNPMDFEAMDCVSGYVFEHLDRSERMPILEVYIVWKSKVLQNYKYLISTSLPDGMYYEVTYNGDTEEWYLDSYKKFENRVIKRKKGRTDDIER